MRDPLNHFRENDDDLSDVVKAARRREILSALLPLVCIGLAGAFVMCVIKYGSSAPASLSTVRMETPEALVTPGSVEAERAAMARMSAATPDTPQSAASPYDIGDEVELIGAETSFGFAEETDLNTFRMMLRSGDATKASRYFAQLQVSGKSSKLPAVTAMPVASVAWNGTLCLQQNGRRWWVAPEWVKPASEAAVAAAEGNAAAEHAAPAPQPAPVAKPAAAEEKPALAPQPAPRKSYLDSLPTGGTLGGDAAIAPQDVESSMPDELK